MAKRISIEISDGTDGSHADQTVPFGLGGVSYEIANAGALRSSLTWQSLAAPAVAASRSL
ncbi:histone-like nucleoid-structuring protein Lsr2 [Amycolatopsis sp. NPDC101161]|uniref:Lsr2 dimerization domain-containing protein n=1 Tax=Amycolatopsis sp. NPDC101161 TaxID=3363940 RepID=UPI003803C2D2